VGIKERAMISNVYLGSDQLDTDKRVLQAIRNLTFPSISFQSVKKGGFPGQTISPGKPRTYKFSTEWAIVGDTFSDLATQRQSFVEILGKILEDETKTFKISKANGINVQIDVKSVQVTGDISANDPLKSNILIEFETEYPYLQSQTEQSVDTNIFTGGGMTIPMSIPMSMGVGGANEVTLTNNGNAPAYPVYTFNGPLLNPSLTNLTTGKTFNLTYNLSDSSRSIVVDTFNRTVVLNPGQTNLRNYASGDFWTLARGANVIHLSAGTYNAQGKCTIKFRNHYLGI
jgi:phage-related protein